MLAPGGALVKLCAPLTTFTSLANFQLWYDVVCDKQGWKARSRVGKAARLDYYSAPKHAPQLEIGQPVPAPLTHWYVPSVIASCRPTQSSNGF